MRINLFEIDDDHHKSLKSYVQQLRDGLLRLMYQEENDITEINDHTTYISSYQGVYTVNNVFNSFMAIPNKKNTIQLSLLHTDTYVIFVYPFMNEFYLGCFIDSPKRNCANGIVRSFETFFYKKITDRILEEYQRNPDELWKTLYTKNHQSKSIQHIIEDGRHMNVCKSVHDLLKDINRYNDIKTLWHQQCIEPFGKLKDYLTPEHIHYDNLDQEQQNSIQYLDTATDYEQLMMLSSIYITQSIYEENDKLCVKIFDKGYWSKLNELMPRKEDTLLFQPEFIQDIMGDIRNFYNSYTKKQYEEMGIPYKKNILFYGIPGTGKTSFIHVIATTFNKNIYTIKLNSKIGDKEFTQAVQCIKDNGIFVIEDIDCIFTDTRRIAESQRTAITLSCLLNFLDGLNYKNGLITILTTNYKGSLDTALLRPGRMDRHIYFDYASEAQIDIILQKRMNDIQEKISIFHPFTEEEVQLIKLCKKKIKKWLTKEKYSVSHILNAFNPFSIRVLQDIQQEKTDEFLRCIRYDILLEEIKGRLTNMTLNYSDMEEKNKLGETTELKMYV